MQTKLTREDAIALLRKYNKEPFHILHGLTVGGVLKWYANELGYGDEAGFWEICGILHDIDFEEYPEEHCLIAPRLLKEGGAEDEVTMRSAATDTESTSGSTRSRSTRWKKSSSRQMS